MPPTKRLIETAFPLKQVSLDSVHEKNVRHGHISTMHIWPARRPLAAARAALIATLLPDPEDSQQRRATLHRMAGHVVPKDDTKQVDGRPMEARKEETEGGILHWGRESGPDLDWFRDEIRKAYDGRAPKVLDPFAGGGAIPLEAMRLGCDVTAMDINPVAWFILKCTLQYPQELAGQTRPLPAFALEDREFMVAFLKNKGLKGAGLRTALERVGHRTADDGVQLNALPDDNLLTEADLAWHLRAWGRRILDRVRRKLASHYPTYAEFQPLAPTADEDRAQTKLLEVDEDGVTQLGPLNAEFGVAYLKDKQNPRWIAKPTAAYLWARTVVCKQCRATLPLLKTRWLCKTDRKRVLLTMEVNADRRGVVFAVEANPPEVGGNGAQRREHDRQIGSGTMTRRGATCPCCGAIMIMEDIRREGLTGRLGEVMIAVVVDGPHRKEYRPPTQHELAVASQAKAHLDRVYSNLPFGLPDEPICAGRPSPNSRGASGLPRYGFGTWRTIFTDRQLLALGEFVNATQELRQKLDNSSPVWNEAVIANLALATDRLADYSSSICSWNNGREVIRNTFARFALPMVWDYIEVNPLSNSSGSYSGALDWVVRVVAHALKAAKSAETPVVLNSSVTEATGEYDVIVTDPPYYDAIPYSDLMDFFHVWLRRSTHGISAEIDAAFGEPLGPKWNHDSGNGELVDQYNRFAFDANASKAAYEEGMLRAFQACHQALRDEGRLVVAFANKQPQAWGTLVSALIRSGFVVGNSWPIQTEMQTKVASGARLASSIWLVCKKRPPARHGWDNVVLAEMRGNITRGLHDFWDAGIRGPDFVWAATGPALEAFSKYPVVRKANSPGEAMRIEEFLREVRRMVVDFVVGQVLDEGGGEAVTGLDDLTTYYLLHRNDFGMEEAPIGACILYALSCNLSDSALGNQYDLLIRARGRVTEADQDDAGSDEDVVGEVGSGTNVKLKPWHQRQSRNLGFESTGGRPAPLIDQVHRLMHLWRAGDQVRVNEYLEARGLQRSALFSRLLQAIIELAPQGSDERSVLESISNHCANLGDVRAPRQPRLQLGMTL